MYANGKPAARLSTPYLRQWGPHFFRGGSAPDLPPDCEGTDGHLVSALLRRNASAPIASGEIRALLASSAVEEQVMQQRRFWGGGGEGGGGGDLPAAGESAEEQQAQQLSSPSTPRSVGAQLSAAGLSSFPAAGGGAHAPGEGNSAAQAVAEIITSFMQSRGDQLKQQQHAVTTGGGGDEEDATAAAVAAERRATQLRRRGLLDDAAWEREGDWELRPDDTDEVRESSPACQVTSRIQRTAPAAAAASTRHASESGMHNI